MEINKKIKILLIGPYLPPYGGVSVHISRLVGLLQNEFNLDFIDESPVKKKAYFNIRSLNVFKYIRKITACDVLYIHSGTNILRCIHIITGKLFVKKTILVLHGFSSKPDKLTALFNGKIYRLADSIVVANHTIAEVFRIPTHAYVVKEAFLPPDMSKEPPLPIEISSLLAARKEEGKIIICANAFRLDKYNNQDLYGVDMCIELARRLKAGQVPFFFIFVLSSIGPYKEDFLQYLNIIRSLNLEEDFCLLHQKLSFVKIMERSDVVVRPTNTDGDSLTIREGLFLGKQVIASDAVVRPKGTIIFHNRNFDDFEAKFKEFVLHTISLKEKVPETSKHLNEELKHFYMDLVQKVF